MSFWSSAWSYKSHLRAITNWEVDQIDVHNAVLPNDSSKEVYIKIPYDELNFTDAAI